MYGNVTHEQCLPLSIDTSFTFLQSLHSLKLNSFSIPVFFLFSATWHMTNQKLENGNRQPIRRKETLKIFSWFWKTYNKTKESVDLFVTYMYSMDCS